MYRVALRATNREYEIDHWFCYADTLEAAKGKASAHAKRTLGWKSQHGELVSPLGMNVSYNITKCND